jgi:hypothetical protein
MSDLWRWSDASHPLPDAERVSVLGHYVCTGAQLVGDAGSGYSCHGARGQGPVSLPRLGQHLACPQRPKRPLIFEAALRWLSKAVEPIASATTVPSRVACAVCGPTAGPERSGNRCVDPGLRPWKWCTGSTRSGGLIPEWW